MNRLRNLTSIIVIALMAFGAGYLIAQSPDGASVQAQNETTADLFAPVIEVYEQVNQRYVDPLDSDSLIRGAIDGMLASIGDENTNYMSEDEYSRWEESLSGEFEGIGATVRKDEDSGALVIVSPLTNSPAQNAGIRAGDQIIEVNGEDITTLSQTEIINRVRGPAGTPVRLGILRGEGDDAEKLEFTVIRDRIVLPDVEYRMLDNNVGYIRMHQFSQRTTANLQNALRELNAENLDGLVLDLRNNPGGYLDTSLQVISQFVSEGPILIEQLPGGREQVFEASGGALAPTVPLAVLVDQGSASASELVAGALRDRERAVIIGQATFGKNTVQTVNPLRMGGALRVTIARWVTPNGNSSSPEGLTPDVVIELDLESDPEFDNQMQAAIRALKGILRQQLSVPTGAI